MLLFVGLITSAEPLKLELSNAVITAVRIYASAILGDMNFVYPEVASIVVANEHGRRIAVYNSAARGRKFVCSG